MTVVTVDDLHLAPDPEQRLATRAALAHARAGDDRHRIIVRAPDRQTNGIRVLQQRDIADMLRQHGRIIEIGTTEGGTIVAAADVCDRRGDVAIWTGYAIGPWHPQDILDRGLGGSETAAWRLAEQLADMGYVVTLYGQFEQEGLVGDVMLRDFQHFDPNERLDCLIGFRDASLFDNRPNAAATFLWLEDLPGQERLTPPRLENIDRVVPVTRWHGGDMLRAYPWIDKQKMCPSRNGIVTDWYTRDPTPDRERRVVYSSSPDRGGDIMLEIWPYIREEVPDAELILTYSRWYDLVAQRFEAAYEHRKRLVELLDQPGVRRIDGGMGQQALAMLMRSSLVWAHPSWYSGGDREFHETSCISAMEAQAGGCVVVCSNWGALTETVEHGTLIDGDPRDETGSWRHAFIDAIIQGLTDPQLQRTAQELGPEYMRDMGWRGPAEQLASWIPRRAKANL